MITRFHPIVKHFHKHNLHRCACAVANASAELNDASFPAFSPAINHWLCEALFFLLSNDDPQAQDIRKLIVEYRNFFGLSLTDFNEVPEEEDCNFPPVPPAAANLTSFILDNTERNQLYYLSDIEYAASPYSPSKKFFKECMTQLIEMQYFKNTGEKGVLQRLQ